MSTAALTALVLFGALFAMAILCCCCVMQEIEPRGTFEERFPGHKLQKNGRPPLELMFPNLVVDPFDGHSAPRKSFDEMFPGHNDITDLPKPKRAPLTSPFPRVRP